MNVIYGKYLVSIVFSIVRCLCYCQNWIDTRSECKLSVILVALVSRTLLCCEWSQTISEWPQTISWSDFNATWKTRVAKTTTTTTEKQHQLQRIEEWKRIRFAHSSILSSHANDEPGDRHTFRLVSQKQIRLTTHLCSTHTARKRTHALFVYDQ